jgi:hypothetical protein
MKSFVLAVAAVVLATGCAASQEDVADETGAAHTGTDGPDLLAECPQLDDELIQMTATVAPTSNVVVEQRIPHFDGSGESIHLISPEVHYRINFKRGADGQTKFRLVVGPFFGVGQSIESNDKAGVASGHVTLNADKRSGTLDIDTRSDRLDRIFGQENTVFAFSNFSCGGEQRLRMTVTAPVVSLEKPGSAAGTAAKDATGRDVEIAPKVDWRRRSPSGSLRFTPTFG